MTGDEVSGLPRIHEVRFIVLVGVKLADSTLLEALSEVAGRAVTQVVSDEIESNLESLSYVDWVVVSVL